jgi:hypothetical protein
MLKFFFWTLLAVNGVLFAYERGYLESVFPSGREPARMAGQINADKVKIVPPPEANPPAAPGTAEAPALPPASPAPEAAPPAAPAQPAATPPAGAKAPEPKPVVEKVAATAAQPAATAAEKKPDLMACLEIGNFNPDDAKRFSAQLKTAGLAE